MISLRNPLCDQKALVKKTLANMCQTKVSVDPQYSHFSETTIRNTLTFLFETKIRNSHTFLTETRIQRVYSLAFL